MIRFWMIPLALTLKLSLPAFGAEELPTRDCFYYHMKAAVKRNQERRVKYAELAGDKVYLITGALIMAERITFPIAHNFDHRARPFQERGLPIICEELVHTMAGTPEFKPHVPPIGEIPEHFESVGGARLKRELTRVLNKEGAEALIARLDVEIEKLAKRPSFHCLMRNELRSIRRAALLIPKHVDRARELGLDEAEVVELSQDLIRKWLTALTSADIVDRVVFPMQKEGIAIICQDFPLSSEVD